MQVLLAADIRLLCDGVAHYLRRVPGVTVAGMARNGREAVAQSVGLKPDILLVDMAMSESLRVVREISARVPDVRIVALSVPEVGGAVIACAEAGISAYVAREGSLEDLVDTLNCVMRGEAPIPPRIAAALLRRVSGMRNVESAANPRSPLTAREEEIVALMEQGLSNKQIARHLQIRLPTVKNHVHHILEKLQVTRRADIGSQRNQRVPAGAEGLDRFLNLS